MTQRRGFYRKLGYILAIAVLCFPVYELGHPASVDTNGHRAPGGYLAQLRDDEKYRISEASLGEVDPTGSTIELASLGLNGVAVLLLWESAHDYQMKEDWSSYSAALEQIIRLEPHFWSVWDFQGHNLSYNISVEFDDYRDRFAWVMKGIEFLKRGMQFNSTDPRFLARIGWFFDNKIGRADEHVQYRQLFKTQQEEKNEKPTDNYLMAYEWYIRAQNLVDSGRPLRVYISGEQEKLRNKPGERAPSPLLFHNEPPMALIHYGETMEEEGTFGEKAKGAWENAHQEWNRFSSRDLSTAYNYTVQLRDLESVRSDMNDAKQKLEKLMPGQFQKIHQTKISKLSDDERKALEKSPKERSAEENNLAATADYKTKATWDEVADQAPDAVRPEARRLAADIAALQQKTSTIDTFRDIVNYNYWLARVETEPTDDCLLARDTLFNAGVAYEGDLQKAKELYEQSFEVWRRVLDKSPVLRDSQIMADELNDDIDKYKKLLGQIGAKLPEPFILQDMVDLHEGKRPSGEELERRKLHDSAEPDAKETEPKPREA